MDISTAERVSPVTEIQLYPVCLTLICKSGLVASHMMCTKGVHTAGHKITDSDVLTATTEWHMIGIQKLLSLFSRPLIMCKVY